MARTHRINQCPCLIWEVQIVLDQIRFYTLRALETLGADMLLCSYHLVLHWGVTRHLHRKFFFEVGAVKEQPLRKGRGTTAKQSPGYSIPLQSYTDLHTHKDVLIRRRPEEVGEAK